MAYERNTAEGIRTWLTAETTGGWNSSAITKGLTEDVMTIIIENYSEFDTKIRQGIILSALYMRKGDFLSLGDGLNKVLQIALNDSDDFVKTTAHVLRDYPTTQQLDLNIDAWSNNFKLLLHHIGGSIKKHGFNFHPLEDMILQPNARKTPPYVSSTYNQCKSTHTQHFTLTTEQKDIISFEARHARFSELVETEERSEQAEQQAAQAVAQKRAGAELQSKAKRLAPSPTSNLQTPFPFPPVPNQQPVRSGGGIPVRQNSLGSSTAAAAGASSLYTKRPARPTVLASGGLFIKQQKPGQRPIIRQTSNGATSSLNKPLASNLPRGLQKVQKTQMLDFSAASEFEQNTANALKKAQDDIKAKQDAKKHEALEKKQRAAAEKREKEEAKKAQKLVQQQAAAEALAESQAIAARIKVEAVEALPYSPTSPTSPKVKHEHIFAVPALPAHYQHQQGSSNNKAKTPPTEKLTTF